MASHGKESSGDADSVDAPSAVRRSWDSLEPEAFQVALGTASSQAPRPAGGASLWIAIALPEQNASGQLISTIAQRLSRAGFVQHAYQPTLFLRHAIANPKALALMIEALVGKAAVWGMQMAILGGDAEPTLTDVLTQLESLPRAIVRLKAQWLMPLVLQKRVFCQLQTVFDARGQVWAEEAFARAEPSADRMEGGTAVMEAADELDVAAPVDRLVRIDAFRALAAAGRSAGASEPARLIVHLSRATLKQPAALAASVLELARNAALPPERVILCVRQRFLAELEPDADLGAGLSAALSGETTSVVAALDVVRRTTRSSVAVTVETDATSLSELFAKVRPGVVKIDAAHPRFASLVDEAAARGALVLASRVESPATLDKAQVAGAQLFSGFHLGRPRRT